MTDATPAQLLEDQHRRIDRGIKGIFDGSGGLAELAEALGLTERWQQLQVHVAEARTKNELNGQIIHTRLEGTRARLRFLRRHLGASAPLYGADGYRRASAYSGRLHAGA